MCGIYAVALASKNSKTSKDRAGQQVLDGLKRLEYRGYDSWGVAVEVDKKISLDKHIGKIGSVVSPQVPAAAVALGHTRWATHGGVTDINAHPHAASDGSFVLVQNGVMENYQEMKTELMAKGYTFISQTDTEVIVHLVEETRRLPLDKKKGLSFEAVCEAFCQLTGRNTIAVLTHAGNIYAVRDGSPLVVGKDKKGNFFLSSDVVSLAADASEYYALESREAIKIENGKAELFDVDRQVKLPLLFSDIDVDATKLDKNGFADFMLKEIYEQAEVLEKPLRQPKELLEAFMKKLKTARHVYTIGAGSADFVSTQISFFLRQKGIFATPIKAYESRSFQGVVGNQDICLVVSQSGETADTVEVIEWMKQKGVTIASIVNMPGSTISRLSDFPFMLQIGPEIGIASTKAVSSTMVWGKALAEMVAGKKIEMYQAEVRKYQSQLSNWLSHAHTTEQLKDIAVELAKMRDIFILGRGQLYMPTLESALKLKEISYLHAEGFSGGELKHGVIALIEKGTPVICLIAHDQERADMLSAAAEVKARGACVIGIAAQENELFDEWIAIPDNEQFVSISSFIPAQLLTYYIALEKGLDPDKPRNLAKSVTVK